MPATDPRHVARMNLLDGIAWIPSDFLKRVQALTLVPDSLPEREPEPVAEAEPQSVGQRVAEVAYGAWEDEIREPKGRGWPRIDEFIRGLLGLMWTTADAKTWKPDAAYIKNGMFAWCGAFMAWCWGHVGLKEEIRRKHCASTYRLYQFCVGTPRDIPLEEALPGDVAIVSNGSKRYGEHVTVVHARRDDGLITTIEGNARGLGAPKAGGEVYEGVIMRTRPLTTPAAGRCPLSGRPQSHAVIKVYRFLPEDLAA